MEKRTINSEKEVHQKKNTKENLNPLTNEKQKITEILVVDCPQDRPKLSLIPYSISTLSNYSESYH